MRATRVMRSAVLALVLATAAFVVPDSAVKSTEMSLVKLRGAAAVDADDPVVWILAVGSDARPGQNMLRVRADALQLVGINTRTGAASAIGFPRDSWVPIPGHGYNRINAALTFGGPELQGRTVGNFVGIQPDYVFVTRFPFFEDMVSAIGGIEVNNPRPFSDPYLRPKGFKGGRIHLNGYDAMAFSRIRKNLAGGDFDRSANQQRVLRGIHAKIRANADRPGFMERGVLSVMSHLHTNVRPTELFELAQLVSQVEPGKIRTCVIGGSIGNVGGASIVRPNVAQARRLGNDARRDATLRSC
ncbi:LCP family protein [Nocardioides sp. GCM10027113]|uniref:LCP family protein n=1 Tax=unclassified Nocardioides TaxID=2615069 RepID=UPI003612BA4F